MSRYNLGKTMSQDKLLKQALEELNKFQKPSVPFKFDTLIDDDILGSKIHGTPYWEEGVAIPKDKKGKPLQLMAQLNLAKMPELPHFPKSGILQFFLSLEDTYGIDFDEPFNHKLNKVIYWSNPDMGKYSPYPTVSYEGSPSEEPLAIEPQEMKMESCGPSDEYNFDHIFKNNIKKNLPKVDEDQLYDFLCDQDDLNNSGSKIGGYPYFTQGDPRSYDNDKLYNALGCKKSDHKEFIILLQLDSDHDSMMWGDCGVANWHILKEDLEKLDFSRVFYTWDCC
jgi:uncharacterized protein YwqG